MNLKHGADALSFDGPIRVRLRSGAVMIFTAEYDDTPCGLRGNEIAVMVDAINDLHQREREREMEEMSDGRG